ncbi:hypothetical protein CALCODRAFT_182639 [Calocera cornea HHB12733]|uniref:Secreted protein n=1 Tax=Calocera cornea HHB12733 TaxID=1353952 RepID=A0A165HSC0_9BASI|nr:hypothetical protein CALCODRAFT_182639 [Calocera cornea HHB12733]
MPVQIWFCFLLSCTWGQEKMRIAGLDVDQAWEVWRFSSQGQLFGNTPRGCWSCSSKEYSLCTRACLYTVFCSLLSVEVLLVPSPRRSRSGLYHSLSADMERCGFLCGILTRHGTFGASIFKVNSLETHVEFARPAAQTGSLLCAAHRRAGRTHVLLPCTIPCLLRVMPDARKSVPRTGFSCFCS